MKIRSLQLEHFRKFTEPKLIIGLTDGINVLAECNEFGKSTILAAIRGVLFERHSSKAQSIASMQHWSNKTSPVVSLEFELAGESYRIEKRFLHKEPYAKLTMPDSSIHQGDAAEERLQQLLNFTRAGNTGSKPDNMGMWGRCGFRSGSRSIRRSCPTLRAKVFTAVLSRKLAHSPEEHEVRR